MILREHIGTKVYRVGLNFKFAIALNPVHIGAKK
jgi:hypothetical protein